MSSTSPRIACKARRALLALRSRPGGTRTMDARSSIITAWDWAARSDRPGSAAAAFGGLLAGDVHAAEQGLREILGAGLQAERAAGHVEEAGGLAIHEQDAIAVPGAKDEVTLGDAGKDQVA